MVDIFDLEKSVHELVSDMVREYEEDMENQRRDLDDAYGEIEDLKCDLTACQDELEELRDMENKLEEKEIELERLKEKYAWMESLP